jgi:hypothetical protein
LRDNALNDADVGDYMADHFISASQKVGTFRVLNGQKQGGNVASYFCRPDGTVVHAIPGKVDAQQFLAEARFSVELDKLAVLNGEKSALKQKLTVADGHMKRLKTDSGLVTKGTWNQVELMPTVDRQLLAYAHLGQQQQVSALLMQSPLPKLELLYPVVWEKILNERLNVAPVVTK